MGQGFQFVGGQLFPLTQSGEVPLPRQAPNELGSSAVEPAHGIVAAPSAAIVAKPQPAVLAAAKPLEKAPTPKDVVRMAKRRAAEIRRELARAKKLAVELAQLERLIAAADGKPIAVVRDLASKRTAG